jgi:hypothetical protein
MPEEKGSTSVKHFRISLIKSLFRIIGCSLCIIWTGNAIAITALAISFLFAEILGIVEEL